MNYEQTLNWMFGHLRMYQKEGKKAFKKNLNNILAFVERLDNPHSKFKSIHVAGTNGKGSTCHILASIMQEAGYKVGLYTSPHLKNFTERIKINGKEVSRKHVINFIAKNQSFLKNQNLSFFEMTVGMAFDYFAKQKVDFAIIEVGLGGRLDSTNIIKPLVSVITNIGLDHTEFLGTTLKEIALEKAGIIKPNIPVVIGEKQKDVENVFFKKSYETKSKLTFASNIKENYQIGLLGDYQKKNAKTAVATARLLRGYRISEKNIIDGMLKVIDNTNFKGRWQILQENPKIICDTAHNKESLEIVLSQLKKEKYINLHVVLGFVSDKKLENILPLFSKDAKYYFCKPNLERGLNESTLQEKASLYNLKGKIYFSVKNALEQALLVAKKEDLIYVGGSTYVVAEVIK